MVRRGLVLLVSLCLLLLAGPAQALYLFYMREDLDRLIRTDSEQIVGKKVCFTDELTIMWPQVQQRPDNLSGTQYVLFDTEKFHCAVPRNNMGTHLESIWNDAQKGHGEALTRLSEINDSLRANQLQEVEAENQRRDLYWQLYKVYRNQPIVTVYGTVTRADFWGPVKGREQGVSTEAITIVVDRVEQPRQRWYEEGLDERPYNDRE